MAIAKRCSCGAAFTLRAWNRLRCLGTTGDGQGKYLLDYRNCPGCGSTMAMRAGRISKEHGKQQQHQQA